MRNIIISFILISFAVLYSSCSTTKLIPEGEMLYTGTKKIEIENPEDAYITKEVESQVVSALSTPPNNAFFGSNNIRIPFPFGLWVYNAFKTDKEKGFKRWIFNKFATDPKLISDVDPSLRAKVAETLMDDNGYFDGKVSYEIIQNEKNPKKAFINYIVNFENPYRFSSVDYVNNGTKADSMIALIKDSTGIKVGNIFNVNNLEEERTRLSDYLRENGYYYFRPDFISYLADSTITKNEIALKVQINKAVPVNMQKPFYISNIEYSLKNSYGRNPNDTTEYKNIDLYFRNKLPVRGKVLYNALDVLPGDLYRTSTVNQTNVQLNRLNSFRFVEFSFTPKDSTLTSDSLNMTISTSMDLPYDAEMELNVTTKSNKQTGPGAVFGVTKRNIFRGGEVFGAELRASYEWQTGEGARNNSGNDLINSYEFGANFSLTVPRILGPQFFKVNKTYPSSTVFKISADLLNRAGFFKLMNSGGSMSYNFNSSPTKFHSFTPFSLTYNSLINKTAVFDSIMNNNEALSMSFKNQFIPSMGYSFTYDNSSVKGRRNYIWWQTSVVSAGNILYGMMELCGNKQGNDKTLFGNQFSQFAKVVTELRNKFILTPNQVIATRVLGGVVKPYLNSTVVPYNEQFFIGGANSLRGFGVRTLGPGSYHPASNALYSYLDQTGNLKFEANIEYRFRIMGDLHGALFADAGNIWLLDKEESRPGGEIDFKKIGKQIATDVGFGLRYDITFIVIRVDIGVPIHAPYDTGKNSYYNIRKFFPSLGWHLAIGYPF